MPGHIVANLTDNWGDIQATIAANRYPIPDLAEYSLATNYNRYAKVKKFSFFLNNPLQSRLIFVNI